MPFKEQKKSISIQDSSPVEFIDPLDYRIQTVALHMVMMETNSYALDS